MLKTSSRTEDHEQLQADDDHEPDHERTATQTPHIYPEGGEAGTEAEVDEHCAATKVRQDRDNGRGDSSDRKQAMRSGPIWRRVFFVRLVRLHGGRPCFLDRCCGSEQTVRFHRTSG
jgi:hypothetical protein